MEMIYGTTRDDIRNSGTGNDAIFKGAIGSNQQADNGNDILKGGAGNDILFGGGDDDILNGDGGRDRLFGGMGNDGLVGDGLDQLDGGAGDDAAVLIACHSTADLTFHMNNPSIATTLEGVGTTVINCELFYIQGGSGNDRLATGAGDDTLFGGAGKKVLKGGAGDDQLFGSGPFGTGGRDRLFGKAGNDSLYSEDNQILDGGAVSGDTALLLHHFATAALSFTMRGSSTVTKLLGHGTTVVNCQKLVLYGGAGNDRFITGAGDDELSGGAGNDLLKGRGG